ncbi:MAG: holo-ACP synthase [Bacteroidetes bacterium]|nr:holo-ACP synthase [Bacteroidota bacterium]HET6244634.1 holo-ACP synthase [Bacteroidia bacterium]
MIAGIGIDLIETERVAEKIAKEGGFREYVFSESEIQYCESKTNKAENYAARFAAKEALLKAIGTGMMGNFVFNEMEIATDDMGKPSFNFTGGSKILMDSRKYSNIMVSLSHLKGIACAMVVIEL